MKENVFLETHVVLVGGGHTHLQLIKRVAMNRMKKSLPEKLRRSKFTMISSEPYAPYSGMLPGLLGGWYSFEEAHFDLRVLCEKAGVRFVHDEVIRISSSDKKVFLKSRPEFRYDLCSINAGIQPKAIVAESDRVLNIKPISRFLPKWNTLLEEVKNTESHQRIAVVGAGAAGLEIALILKNRLKEKAKVSVLTKGELLANHASRAASLFTKELKKGDIEVRTHQEIRSANQLADFDFAIVATEAQAPHWLRESKLPVDEDGFLLVDSTLKVHGLDIFGAGDCINFNRQSLPKAGVYAVRQGPILCDNIQNAILNRNLKRYRPQDQFLSLITTGKKNAIATKGNLAVQADWLWNYKDAIDRKFMRKFSRLPSMTEDLAPGTPPMQCGGCASKVGPEVLSDVLKETLDPNHRVEDVATIGVGQTNVFQSIDYFQDLIDDPYLFGAILAEHAMNDLFSKGIRPEWVLANLCVQRGAPKWVRSELRQLLAGVQSRLEKANVKLKGGHSFVGDSLGAGLVVNGTGKNLIPKGPPKSGDVLYVTKPIGTGVVLKAYKQGKAKGTWLEFALKSMLFSNSIWIDLIQEFARCSTDISGFGLMGHLNEMLDHSNVTAEIEWERIPTLEGSVELSKAGVQSSLLLDNPDFLKDFGRFVTHPPTEVRELLFDPQTSGGILMAVGNENQDRFKDAAQKKNLLATQIGKIR